MSPSHDVLVISDRILGAQETLIALEHVAPNASVLHVGHGEALRYLFSVGDFYERVPGQPGLVLLSLETNVVGSLCILDLMRAHPSTAEIPVVLLSLEGNLRKLRRHDRFDADAYVTQPVDFQRYCAIIEGCVKCWIPWALRPDGSRRSASRRAAFHGGPSRAPNGLIPTHCVPAARCNHFGAPCVY